MKTPILAALAACMLAAPASAREVSAHLKPLEFLVGSCWAGTFPDGRQVDTHCFTPAFNGNFIRDVHVVTGGNEAYSGETIYRWDPETNVIRFVYFSLPGGFSQGEAHPGAEAIAFPDVHVARDGTRRKIDTVWTPDGPDAYKILSRIEDGRGGWREMLNMRMVRSGPATAPR